jgi:hypothetical protein
LAEVLVIIQDRDDIRKAVEAVGQRLGLVVDTFGVREDADEEFGTAESIRLALQAKKITVSEARLGPKIQSVFVGRILVN